MSLLPIIGPAQKSLWISSPVRSRKPVLMKITRSRAASIQASRFNDVRFSSSMIPTLIVVGASPSTSSTPASIATVSATSSGPCCLGLTR